jgi:hypothetical protein
MASQRKSFAADLIRNLAVIFLLAGLVWYLARDFAEKGKGTDFPDFYAAARMVRAGMGKQLYDPAMQSTYQARYVGRSGSLYLHPPFEVLVYLPFSWAPLPLAYGLWNLFSAALLIACARLLRPLANRNWSWQLVLGCSVGFTPVLLCFLQGQDSILLLLILLLTLRALSRGQDVVAGVLLACGLFKFHLALPLFVIFAIARKGKFIAGFASSALLLVLASIGIAGWASLLSYPRFLIHFSELPMPGNSPLGMANLHGLVDGLAPSIGPPGIMANRRRVFTRVGAGASGNLWSCARTNSFKLRNRCDCGNFGELSSQPPRFGSLIDPARNRNRFTYGQSHPSEMVADVRDCDHCHAVSPSAIRTTAAESLILPVDASDYWFGSTAQQGQRSNRLSEGCIIALPPRSHARNPVIQLMLD